MKAEARSPRSLPRVDTLKVIGIAVDTAFTMPMTQEKIADVLGLGVPLVNRMLKRG